MKTNWYGLPANAKTVNDVQCCIDFLRQHHPYPANMQIDRESFATARLGYEAAMFNLEKYICKLTETIEMTLLDDGQLEV